ncbi:hypothetical protein CBS101457_003374 [Exobasidium rhododendri]|nr:hypothetical protein CBS101457_003374 [Exobasidium rhododendri]
MVNFTCPVLAAETDPVPFYTNGNINFKAHDVGWIVCGFFTLIASCTSFWLVWKHLTYYTCPQQQRHIVRLLFMVPIYAIVSTLSYVFYRNGIYYQTIRDCYEAVVITSFFNLLLQYIGDTPAEQQEVFREVKLQKWFFPMNYWKYRPDGLHFLWLMKIFILQYAIVRPVCTLTAVGLQYYGIYCLESWEPYFGHIWIALAISVSVALAMYCIVQFYLPIQEQLKPYSPILKFFAVKSVVFLTFWQDSFLSILVYFGAIKQSEYMTAADIQVGINALLETFEMVIFGFIHITAFTYLIYRPADRKRTTKRFKALLDVLDFRDWWYDMKSTSRYVAAKSRGKDFTVVDDIRREKYQHLERALGRDRWAHLEEERHRGKQKMPSFWKDGGAATAAANESDFLMSTSDQEKVPDADVLEKGGDWREESLALREDYGRVSEGRKYEGDSPLEVRGRGGVSSTNSLEKLALPCVGYARAVQSDSAIDVHPELSQYHRTAAEVDNDRNEFVEANGEEDNDVFIPRKGGRAQKEASLGLGTWWRTFRDRTSYHGLEEVGNFRPGDEEEEEERVAPAKATRSSHQIAPEKERCEDRNCNSISLSSQVQRESKVSSTSADASASVLGSRDSPLSLIINEHLQDEERSREFGGGLAKFVSSSHEKQVAIIGDDRLMVRHGSSRAAMEDQERFTASQKIVYKLEGRSGVVKGDSLTFSDASFSGMGALADTPASSMSTAALQKSRRQSKQPAGVIKMTYLKGKSAPIVLHNPTYTSRTLTDSPLTYAAALPRTSFPSISLPSAEIHKQLRGKEKNGDTRSVFLRRDDPEADPIQVAGTVIAGPQSFSQKNTLQSQAEKEGKEQRRQMQTEELHRGRQGRAQEQQRTIARESQAHTRQQRTTTSRQQPTTSQGDPSNRNRPQWTSLRPQAEEQDARQSACHLRSPIGRKDRPLEPYIALPAPSQLAQIDNRQDPFAAAVFASSTSNCDSRIVDARRQSNLQNTAGRGSYQAPKRSRIEEGVGNAPLSFEVGSLLSYQDVINVTSPQNKASHRQYLHRSQYPLHRQQPQRTRHFSNPPQSKDYARHQPGPTPPPEQHHFTLQNPLGHSTGSAVRPAAIASYDRFSGEPIWVNDRQTLSRVESRRRQYEAPPGFQFDYLD